MSIFHVKLLEVFLQDVLALIRKQLSIPLDDFVQTGPGHQACYYRSKRWYEALQVPGSAVVNKEKLVFE